MWRGLELRVGRERRIKRGSQDNSYWKGVLKVALGLPWCLKESTCNAEDSGSPGSGRGDLLEKDPHFSMLAWRLQSMGSQRIGHK